MAQAWLVWAAFGVAYLIFAPSGWGRRIWDLASAGAITVAVSAMWVVPMALIPAGSRPWIDGSVDNSLWSMVFGYNGFNRYGVENAGAEALGIGGPPGKSEGSPWLYLLRDGRPAADVDRITTHVMAGTSTERFAMAVQWAPQAGQFILRDVPVLPVGGFTAQVPTVTTAQLDLWADSGDLRFALVDGPAMKGKPTPDFAGYQAWARLRCQPVAGFDSPLYLLLDCR